MAPPPSPSLPLSQRILMLAQTLQFGWFVGHLTLLFSTLRYGFSCITLNYYSTWAKLSYRLAFISAAVTYGIVVYKAYRARMRTAARQPQSGILPLLADENVQYLAMAIIWLFSRQVAIALLPFAIYSIFHVATYTRTNLLPTFQTQPRNATLPASSPSSKTAATAATTTTTATVLPSPSSLADSIRIFVKEYYDASMGLVAVLELAIWFRLLVTLATFGRGAIFLFVAHTAFLRARYAQSSFVQTSVQSLSARLDVFFANNAIPPIIGHAWRGTKGVVAQVADVTDLSRYVNTAGSGPGPKKAQ
ncbi:MAG: hypothetical protein M1826_004342 [Phylliscum demangeonii]|nr:MAG: hypothetical protein M1826_004342 [Phylliscum demangeonii]